MTLIAKTSIGLTLLLGSLLLQSAAGQEQEGGGASNPRGAAPRGGREHMREFLGLGPAPDAAEVKKGAALYKQNCSGCHGEDGRGSQGPNLIRSVVVLHDEKGETIGPIIKSGRPQSGMPPFPQVSDANIFSISQFLKAQVERAANRGSYGQTYGDLRNKVTGNARQGEAFFNANCTSCHSATGDLAKIGAKFQQASQLQRRFLWPAEPGRLVKVVITTPSGEQISGSIRKEDDFFVSVVDASGQYRSWPKASVKMDVEDKLVGHRSLLPKYSDDDIHDMTAYLVTLK